MSRKLNLLFVLVFSSSTIWGQQNSPDIRPIQIGDTVPNMVLDRIFNSQEKNMRLSDLYKDGLLIINYWATWCSGCINEFPMLDTIRKKFPQKVKVLSVTYQDSAKVADFFSKHPGIKIPDVLMVTDDSLFRNYFRFRYLPHNIWINNKGIVITETASSELIEENVSAILQNRASDITRKHDDMTFNFLKPLHAGDSSFLYRSIITPFADSIGGGSIFDNNESRRFFGWNQPIIRFYWLAFTYMKYEKINWDLIELNTKDSAKFFYPTAHREIFNRSKYHTGAAFENELKKWKWDNLFCYDLIIPKKVPNRVFCEYMFNDLERTFQIHADRKFKKVRCNVVSKYKPGKEMLLKPSTQGKAVFKLNDNKLIIHRLSLDYVFAKLSFEFETDPFVNATGIDYLIDMEIDISKDSSDRLADILEGFKKYGLKCENRMQLHPVLLLTDYSS
jgi:thiol-disulfide isomerase/thioredoxin